MFITKWKLLVSVWMVRNTPYTQIHRFQKGSPSLFGTAVLGAASENRPHQPAALSLADLTPTVFFKQTVLHLEAAFPRVTGRLRRQLLAACRYSTGDVLRTKRMLACFCSVPFSPCSVHECALSYIELTVFFLPLTEQHWKVTISSAPCKSSWLYLSLTPPILTRIICQNQFEKKLYLFLAM